VNTAQRKVAVVTGSATGVGAASALLLAQRGWNLVINYSRSSTEAEASAAACREAGADTLLLRGDVAQDADCRALAAGAVERWGRFDALVNNAGISVFGEDASWDALDGEAFQRIFAVNTVGAFQMVRACTPHLKQSGGCIVNVSSIAGALGIGSSVPYIASKGALNAMTLHLARTLAPEIRVNAVCPGLITTRWFVQGIGAEGAAKAQAGYERMAPLGRASTPQDVAEAIAWLVDGARTVTGELLLLDAGVHLGGRTGR
jgi:3-oxoacyl-[acyl-carrier protein] reductase